MGRHTHPETLDFIKKLKEKGEALGYETQEEYSMLDGLYVADLVWQLGKDQPPLVTFEVETVESLRVFKNTAKYFDTLSEDVPKPFRHFMILMKGKLSEGVRKPIERYISYYNISLFEDVANDQEATKLLFEELSRLKVNLDELVARYLMAGKIDETLSKIFLGIQQGMAGSIIQPKEITLQISSGEKDDLLRPHKVRISAPLPAIQKIHDAMRTGQTATLTKEDGVEIDAPGVGPVRPEKVEIKAETVPGILFSLETTNYSKSLELALERVEATNEYVILTNAKQGAFYTFTCRVFKGQKGVDIDVKLDTEKTDSRQLAYFFDFFERAKKENRLLFRRVSDGKVLMEGPFPSGFPVLTTEELQFYRVLAEIQVKTGVRMLIPKELTAADISTINRLYQVITTGDVEIDLKEFKVSFAKEQAQRIVDGARNPEIIENFQATMSSESVELFGQMIPLGEARVVIPKAKIDLKKLEEDLNEGTDPIPVEINKLPDGTARILYSKWLKPSA